MSPVLTIIIRRFIASIMIMRIFAHWIVLIVGSCSTHLKQFRVIFGKTKTSMIIRVTPPNLVISFAFSRELLIFLESEVKRPNLRYTTRARRRKFFNFVTLQPLLSNADIDCNAISRSFWKTRIRSIRTLIIVQATQYNFCRSLTATCDIARILSLDRGLPQLECTTIRANRTTFGKKQRKKKR